MPKAASSKWATQVGLFVRYALTLLDLDRSERGPQNAPMRGTKKTRSRDQGLLFPIEQVPSLEGIAGRRRARMMTGFQFIT